MWVFLDLEDWPSLSLLLLNEFRGIITACTPAAIVRGTVEATIATRVASDLRGVIYLWLL